MCLKKKELYNDLLSIPTPQIPSLPLGRGRPKVGVGTMGPRHAFSGNNIQRTIVNAKILPDRIV